MEPGRHVRVVLSFDHAQSPTVPRAMVACYLHIQLVFRELGLRFLVNYDPHYDSCMA